MSFEMNRKTAFTGIGILCAIVGCLVFVPAIGDGIRSLGSGLHAANLAYLAEATKEVEHEAAMLGASLAILEIIGSADIGVELIVSANVNIGAALTNLITAVEFTLEISLAFLAGLFVWELLSNVLHGLFAPLLGCAMVLTGLAIASSVWPMLRSVRHGIRLAAEVAVLLALAAHIVLPYSLNLTATASAAFFVPVTDESPAKLLHTELTKDGSSSSPPNHWTKKRVLESALTSAVKDGSAKTSSIRLSGMNRLAHGLLFAVVFPALSFLALWVLFARATRWVFRALDKQWHQASAEAQG